MPVSEKRPERRVPVLGIFLLFLGIAFLLQALNILPWGLWGFLWRFWPVVLIIIGLNFILVRYNRWLVGLLFLAVLFVILGVATWQYSGTTPSARMTSELYSERMGDLKSADIKADYTSLGVSISSLPAGGPDLLWVQSSSAARGGTSVDFRREGDKGEFNLKELRQDWRLWRADSQAQSAMRISRDVPVTVDIKSSLSSLLLSQLYFTGLRVDSDVGNVRVDMPPPAGNTTVYIKADLTNLEFTIPYDTAARFKIKSDLSTFDIDRDFFIKQGDYYVTPDFEQAENRIDVEIDCDLSRVKVSFQSMKIFIGSAF